MSARQNDIEANLKRRDDMLVLVDNLKTRVDEEKTALTTEADGSGRVRDPDLTRRTKREVKADLDDTLLCMLKFQAEATVCRADATKLLKEFERRP